MYGCIDPATEVEADRAHASPEGSPFVAFSNGEPVSAPGSQSGAVLSLKMV